MNKKKSIINSLRDTAKQIESMDMEHLDSFLCTKFGTIKDTFQCNICNKNSYRNKKALATHQRKCLKDNENQEIEESEEEKFSPSVCGKL